MGTAETVAGIASLLSVALDALQAAQAASGVLQQAQAESWSEDDPRWGGAFQVLDNALAAAKARLD